MKPLDEDFKKLVAYCRKNGIQSLKMDGVEINLHPSSFFPESDYKRKKKDAQATGDYIPTEQYGEEDTLFWSSAGLPPEQSGAQ